MSGVLISTDKRVGRLSLDRPQALHALTTDMCREMIATLTQWRADGSVETVLLDHAEGRGFCAGGDVRMLAESVAGDGRAALEFFREEYRLDHLLFTYSKPTIVFMDGIVMGGGAGIALPCRYRIATENTRFAMPETGIGLYPDVGAGWYLSRLPGYTGQFLALTGARLDGAECLHLGLATHYLPQERLAEVQDGIAASPDRIEAVLAEASTEPPPARIAGNLDAIDRHFAHDRLEDILASLEKGGSDWAQKELATIRSKSPQCGKIALRLLAEGKRRKDFESEMRAEYAAMVRTIARPDFTEGVRAVLIDKDNQPRWSPARAEEVTDAMIDAIFAPLTEHEEWHPL